MYSRSEMVVASLTRIPDVSGRRVGHRGCAQLPSSLSSLRKLANISDLSQDDDSARLLLEECRYFPEISLRVFEVGDPLAPRVSYWRLDEMDPPGLEFLVFLVNVV